MQGPLSLCTKSYTLSTRFLVLFAADPQRQLGQLVEILLDNARKYASGGTVRLQLQRSGRHSCHLSLENEGPALSPQQLQEIFKRFTRADPARTRSGSFGLGLAIAQAIVQATGLDARIKWPNDIVCGGRKVCGMLLEMNADEQTVHDVVAGVGINVHQTQFAPEIAQSASSLDLLLEEKVNRAALVRAFLEAFEAADALAAQGGLMDAYRARSATLGQRVQVIAPAGSFTGVALAVTDSGSLIVEDEEGQRREVLAADVSVRGLMGYA